MDKTKVTSKSFNTLLEKEMCFEVLIFTNFKAK